MAGAFRYDGPSPMGLASFVQQQGMMGKQQGEDSRLARLVSGAMSDPSARKSNLAEIASFRPEAAFQAQDQFAQQDDRKYAELGKRAAVLAGAPEAMRGQVWAQLRPELEQTFGMQGLPAEVTPEILQTAQQLAQVYGGMGRDGQVSVRSSFVGEDGQMYSIMSDGSVKAQGVGADRKLQAFDVPGVGPQVVDLRAATARTVTPGGGAPRSAPASTFAFTPAPGTEGDPAAAEFQSLPADQQQVAAQLLQRGQDFTIQGGRVVPAAMRGGQPMRPTLDQMPISQVGGGEDRPAWVRPPSGAAGGNSEMDRRIELARSAGASDDDIRRMILGRDAAAGGSKPMPASVLKMREQTVAEAETANTINLNIDKHLSRIRDGSLKFGPVQNLLSQGRNFVNESTPESRNFAEFRADLEKLRNDSLRLNAGVQTDGDAKRAWDELVANINDAEYVKQRLETIRLLNERAALLKQESVERIDAEYGRANKPDAPPADDEEALIGKYL